MKDERALSSFILHPSAFGLTPTGSPDLVRRNGGSGGPPHRGTPRESRRSKSAPEMHVRPVLRVHSSLRTCASNTYRAVRRTAGKQTHSVATGTAIVLRSWGPVGSAHDAKLRRFAETAMACPNKHAQSSHHPRRIFEKPSQLFPASLSHRCQSAECAADVI